MDKKDYNAELNKQRLLHLYTKAQETTLIQTCIWSFFTNTPPSPFVLLLLTQEVKNPAATCITNNWHPIMINKTATTFSVKETEDKK